MIAGFYFQPVTYEGGYGHQRFRSKNQGYVIYGSLRRAMEHCRDLHQMDPLEPACDRRYAESHFRRIVPVLYEVP